LHKRLANLTEPKALYGIDINEERVTLLQRMGFGHVIQGDVQQLASDLRKQAFDIILAGEII
jgi:hypothetical protein